MRFIFLEFSQNMNDENHITLEISIILKIKITRSDIDPQKESMYARGAKSYSESFD